ncbi:MAG: LAGLIDADG family homing endonuclease, partial [Candidatus Hermodarchaeia archaeon]
MSTKKTKEKHQGLVQVYTGDGKGKCVSPDTWITTGTGLKKVADIVRLLGASAPKTFKPIHLEVATHEGPQSAKALYNGGFCNTITIKTRFGYELEGTLNHPVLTLTPEGLKWQRLEHIALGDYVAIARNQGLFGSTHRNQEDAYLAGLLLGDGHLVAKKRMWRITLTNSEPSIIQVWKKYLNRFDMEFKTYPNRPNDYRIDGKDIVQKILHELWLDARLSYEKEISSEWLGCNHETIKALLQGLFDTDGSVFGNPPTIEFSSSSLILAKQVHLLLLHYGIIAKHYARTTSRRPNHRLLIRGVEVRKFFNKIGFRLDRKQRREEDLPKNHNTNVDIIPYTWDLIKRIPLSPNVAEKKSRKGPTPYLKNQFYRLTRYYRERGVNASYARFIELLEHPAVVSSQEKDALKEVCLLYPFWDQIIEKKPGQNQVYDFNVPDAQSFIGNGVINHNTTAALGLGLRAAGHGFEVYMIQFMKGQINYGELEAVKHIPN